MQQIQISKLFKLASGNGFKEELQGRESGDYGFYKVSDINGSTKYALNPVNFVSSHDAAQNRWNIIPQGSIVTAKIGAALSKNHRKILKQPSIIDNNMLAFIPNKKMLNHNYAYWLLKNVDMKDFENISTVPSINMSQLRQGKVTVLDTPIQQKIADFLDDETAQIDNLIAKQERLLELLEEKRRATITHAVTRGLDPNVELKETNIPWLGQIPAHWGVERVAALYRRKRVKDHPDEELLSVYRDYGVIVKSSRDDNHNTESEDLSNYQLVEPDDLVTNKMKTWQGSIAVSEIRGIVSPAYFILSPTSQTLNPRYVHYQLRSDRYIAQYKSISKGIRPGQWDLDYEQFRIMRLTVPPIGEQAKIVKHIEDNEIRTKAIKQKIQTQITLLRERRTSLISHAVTGKIKV